MINATRADFRDEPWHETPKGRCSLVKDFGDATVYHLANISIFQKWLSIPLWLLVFLNASFLGLFLVIFLYQADARHFPRMILKWFLFPSEKSLSTMISNPKKKIISNTQYPSISTIQFFRIFMDMISIIHMSISFHIQYQSIGWWNWLDIDWMLDIAYCF